jgi:nucleotide-binding universal stress UspA family protein
MKRLLIPTDFSDISKNSIKYGFQLAAKLNLNIQLVHVLELYKFAVGTSESELISTILPAENIVEMESLAMGSFKKMLEGLQGSLPSEVNYDFKVVSGHLVNEMVVESALDETELMILAVAGNQDLITRFTHNTISAIIKDAACPVLVIPSGYSFQPVVKVILATDFNKADLEMFSRFIQLFTQFNPHVEVLHISPKAIDFKTELKFAGFKQLIAEKNTYPNVSFKIINHKNVVQGTIETLKADNADMLLILKEHDNFFKSLFESNKTNKIAHFLKVPMISYHELDPIKKK